MKKFTNNQAGPRGINLKDGTTKWIDAGETVEVDEKTILGDVPDLGKASRASAVDDGSLDALKGQVAELTKQVETLTAPAAKDPLDHDGDGKKGGAAKPE